MIARMINYYKSNGFFPFIKKSIEKGLVYMKLVEDIPATRIRLSNHIYKIFDGKVKYGPLKGLQLNIDDMNWSKVDAGSIILGLYEYEVLLELERLSKKCSIFCDVGAGDGILAVGLLNSKLFKEATCFEIDERARKNIRNLAINNNVSQHIEILERANHKSLSSLDINWEKTLILIDIEGEEFNLLDNKMLDSLRGATLIIEIHDEYTESPEKHRDELREKLSNFYDIKTISTSSRDLSGISEIRLLHDNERWLLCSEGRGWMMDWWVCEPREF